MELLLNLVWALLSVSALYAWGYGGRHARSRPHLITLVCLLALLFPVISATDDLHAMRPELEDSATNKRLKQVVGGKAVGHPMIHSPAALAVAAIVPFTFGKASSALLPMLDPAVSAFFSTGPSDRAPPISQSL